ncbi:MAG: hypothetical protein HEP71_11170 [Roseivirga sp.]|nr:hypothetical protein [Roseivirga sp.]
MTIYNHTLTHWLSGTRFIGLIFLLTGVFSILGPDLIDGLEESSRSSWVGPAFISFGLIVMNTYKGTLIDLKNKKFKVYSALAGLKRGTWQDLPELKEVHIGSITEKSTNLPNGISPTFSGNTTAHFLLLMTGAAQAVLSLQFKKAPKAEQAAILISEALELPVKQAP